MTLVVNAALQDLYHSGNQATAELIQAELTTLRAKLAEVERERDASQRSENQLIDERDAFEKAMSDAYLRVVGGSPEWSNLFGIDETLDDIDSVMINLCESLEAEREKSRRLVEFRERCKNLLAACPTGLLSWQLEQAINDSARLYNLPNEVKS